MPFSDKSTQQKHHQSDRTAHRERVDREKHFGRCALERSSWKVKELEWRGLSLNGRMSSVIYVLPASPEGRAASYMYVLIVCLL